MTNRNFNIFFFGFNILFFSIIILLLLYMSGCQQPFTSFETSSDSGLIIRSNYETSTGGNSVGGSNSTGNVGGGIPVVEGSLGGRNTGGFASTGGRIEVGGSHMGGALSTGGHILEAGVVEASRIEETGSSTNDSGRAEDANIIDPNKCFRPENVTATCGGNNGSCCNHNCYVGCTCQFVPGTTGGGLCVETSALQPSACIQYSCSIGTL